MSLLTLRAVRTTLQIVAVGALMECYLQTPPKQSAMIPHVTAALHAVRTTLQIVAVGALMEATF